MEKYNNFTKLDAQQIYVRGQSFAEIARIIGCHRTTVGLWSKKNDWKSSLIQATPEPDGFGVKLASCQTYSKIKVLNEVYQNMMLTGRKDLEEANEVRVRQGYRLVLQACKHIQSQQQALNHTKFLIVLAGVLKRRVTDEILLNCILDDLIAAYDNYNHREIKPRA